MTAGGRTDGRAVVPLGLAGGVGLLVAMLVLVARDWLLLWPWWLEAVDRPPRELLAEVVVPGLVGVAGIGVALASWRTSSRATKIARDAAEAEAARDAKAVARAEDESASQYALRLADRVVLVSGAIETLINEYAAFIGAWTNLTSVERETRKSALVDLQIAAGQEIAVARMVSLPDDREVLERFGIAMHRWGPSRTLESANFLITMSSAIVEWRVHPQYRDGWIAFFDEVTPQVDANALLKQRRATWQ